MMPEVIKNNIPLIQQALVIVGSISAATFGIVTLNLDTRYVKADEVEKLLEPVFSSVDAVDEVEDKVDIHRVEFDAYLKHASEKFDGIERLVLRVDDKLDRLIEMEHTE
tara:strand:- start:47 stop:373 length:327 start_codon:yes stop_codon:yes gene_type:complete